LPSSPTRRSSDLLLVARCLVGLVVGGVNQPGSEQGIERNQAEGGELAAADGNHAVAFPHRVVASLLRGIKPLARGNDRAHAGHGGKNVRVVERHIGELVVDQLQQVLDFSTCATRFRIQRLWMIKVGGADTGYAFPRKDKYRAAIVR